MSDKRLRELERKAQFDPAARERYEQMTQRTFAGPYDHLVGSMVFVFGARKNFRGHLAEINQGVMIFTSWWEICESKASGITSEEQWPVTEDAPLSFPTNGTFQFACKWPH